MPFNGDDLDELIAKFDKRPWGFMRELSAPEFGLTVKYLEVAAGHRTSLQFHQDKDELIYILKGSGFVDVGCVQYRGKGETVRIRPGTGHRVTGPLKYLEISTYDDGTDTVRLHDDYGR